MDVKWLKMVETKQMYVIRRWYDWTIQIDVTKLCKWMWQNYTNGRNQTIQMDVTKLYKWMWPYKWMRQNYTNGWDKTIQMDMAKLNKWMR